MAIIPNAFRNIRYDLWGLLAKLISTGGDGTGGSPSVTLNTLTLDQINIVSNQAASGFILGTTAGSFITIINAPPGFTIDTTNRTWAYNGSAPAAAYAFSLKETLAGAVGSPLTSTINLAISSPAIMTFGLANTNFYQSTPTYTFISGTDPSDVVTHGTLPAGFTIDIPNRVVYWDATASNGTVSFTLTRTPVSGSAQTVTITVTISVLTVAPAPTNFIGINIGGSEEYVTGVQGTGQQAKARSFQLAANRNLMFIRQTSRWENFMPNGLGTTLDATYVAAMKAQCALAYAAGQKWILDIHNYARYNVTPGATTPVIGGGQLQISDFVDLISKVATAFKGTPGYYGLDLMNEPNNMPSLAVSAQMMQAAITAVRDPNGANDQNVVIYVENNNYSSSWQFDSINPGLSTLTDPANRFLIMTHMYPDMDDSGSGLDYADHTQPGGTPYLPYHLQIQGGYSGPSSPAGLSVGPNIGVQRLGNVFNKILSYNFPIVDGFLFCLGEHGIPSDTQAIGSNHYYAPYGNGTDADDAAWRVEADNTLSWCKSHGVQVLLWQAGPQTGLAYDQVDFQNLEPDDSGIQRIQMAVVTKHTGAPEPTVFRLDGPQYADVGVASSPFRITYRGNIASPSVFTPSDNGAGGTFTPASLTMPAGTNYVGTFTYTPASERRIQITVASTAGFTAILSPSAVGGGTPKVAGSFIVSSYSTADDIIRLFRQTSRNPQAILSRTHLINKAWLGPILQLARTSDGSVLDFYSTSLSDDRIDRQAISDWAGTNSSSASNVTVNIVYDQSGNGNHEYPASSGYRASYVLDGGNGYPVEYKTTSTKSSFNCNLEGNDQTVLFDAFWSNGSYVLQATANIGGSIGLTAAGIFETHTGTYPNSTNNTAGSYFTVPNGLLSDTFHTYVYRFQNNTTNGLQSYRDATLVGQTTTTGGTVTWQRYSVDVGWFRFYDLGTRATMQVRNIIVSQYAYSDAEIASLTAVCTNPYKSTWTPVNIGNYPPLITTEVSPNWTVAVGKPVSPFFGCTTTSTYGTNTITFPLLTITNPDGTETVSATLLLSDGTGTLSAPGATQDANNPLLWHYPAMTPAQLTSYLVGSTSPQNVGGAYSLTPGVVFTPGQVGQNTVFTLTVTNSGGVSSTYNGTNVTCVAVAPIDTPFTPPSGPWNPIGNLKGANMGFGNGSAGNGSMISAVGSGGYNYVYTYGNTWEYAWLAGKGFGIARVEFCWRRLLPTPWQPLNTIEVARLKSLLDDAYARGQTLILDAHDYGNMYDGNAAGGTYQQNLTTSPYIQSVFVDAWTRMASLFSAYPNVAFDLMNEPNVTPAVWSTVVRKTIAGIRSVGANQLILIEGGTSSSDANNWASVQNTVWDDFNQPGWTGINGDPANNFAFSPHRYLDGGAGNTSTVVAGSGSTRLASATTWASTTNAGVARANPFRLFLGEFGWSQNDNQSSGGTPSVEGYALCNYMNQHSVWIGGTYFLCGPKAFFAASVSTANNSTEATAAVPTYSGTTATADPPQMAVLLRWLNNT